jgi:hypothetical protein
MALTLLVVNMRSSFLRITVGFAATHACIIRQRCPRWNKSISALGNPEPWRQAFYEAERLPLESEGSLFRLVFYNPNFPALFSRNKLPSRIYRRTI